MATIEIESFTWRNLNADVYSAMHDRAVRLYLDSVVTPALDALEGRIKELDIDADPALAFLESDLESLQSEAIKAFILSVQSLWERQFRNFLIQCAIELGHGDLAIVIERDSWPKLVDRFESLRGLPLPVFDSFSDLSLLHVLGNACRHGDGSAARELFEGAPELWPYWPEMFPGDWPVPPAPDHPPFSTIAIPRDLLVRMARAVIWFWEDHQYVYINSIQRKHWTVEGTLTEMRRSRAARAGGTN